MIQKIRNLDPVYYVLLNYYTAFYRIFKIRVFCIFGPWLQISFDMHIHIAKANGEG